MSLINEALKKAQKLRAADPSGETTPPIPGAVGRVTKRGQARSSQTIVLIGSGAIVLVVLSAVVTFWLVNRPSPAPARPVASAKPTPGADALNDSPPPIVAPVITIPTTPATGTTGSAPASDTPPATRSAAEAPRTSATATPGGETKPPAPAPTTIATSPTPAASPQHSAAPAGAAPAPAAAPKADERIAAYVEALRITAIKASATDGKDSRVFMNDRVYRVNDIVERTLGIKLIKVAPDNLTFADPNGVTYVKYF